MDIISRKLANDMIYAYHNGRFWRWDNTQNVWKESHLMAQKFGRAKAASATLTPEVFLTDGAQFIPLDDYEIDIAMMDSLKDAKPCKTAPIEPVEEEASQRKKGGVRMAESETALQAFDYACLPANMCTVIRANTEEFTLHMNRSVQEYGQACVNVMNVHAALADRYSGRWAQWCQSVGLSIRSATRMVEVGSNVMGSAKLAELVQDGQIGKSLLQAICAPSAEPEAVEQVLSGDITTHKEYQEALKQLKEKDAQLKLSNKRIDELQAHSAKLTCDYNDEFVKRRQAESKLDETRTRLKSACIQEQKSREAMQAAENARDAALADVQGLSEQNNKLKDENAALKKQPITAVVDEEEVDKRAHQQAYAIAADMTSELREQLEAAQSAPPVDPQEDIETATSCIVNITGIWSMATPTFTRLVGIGEEFDQLADALLQTCDRIKKEVIAMIAENDGGLKDE